MLLYIIRHGLPDYKNDCLTPEGQMQAEALAKRLMVHGIDEAYSSSNGRAIQTGKPICDKLGLEMKIISEFSEDFAYSHFTYTDKNGNLQWSFSKQSEMLGSDEMYTATDSFCHGFYNDDEYARAGFAEICAACDRFLEGLGYAREGNGKGNAYKAIAPNEKRVALFCHEGAGLHLISRILNIPVHIFTASFSFSHTGITVINFFGDGTVYPKCLCHSDLSHIYADGLPLKYCNWVEI